MSRDSLLKLTLITFTAVLGGVLVVVRGMSVPLSELVAPLAVVGCLGPCAVFYHRRNTPQFVLVPLAVIHFMVFTSCFTILMYAAATLNFPLIDDYLVAADAALGVHVPSIKAWADEHPRIRLVLFLAYHSVIVQTLVIVLLLGFLGDRRPLEGFVLRFMVCLVITLVFFTFTPAEGPFTAYGYEPSPHQAYYLEHFRTLRSGERTVISLKNAEGLVTFPSFHTSYAILLAAALWHRRRLFVLFALLNAGVVAATMTTGWHYLIDVLAGIAVAAATMLITRRLEPWLYAGLRATDDKRTACAGS